MSKKIDTIKQLENTEIGMFLVVILSNGIRCPSLYMGQPTPGIYQFIDESGIYKMTAGYIREHHITIDQTLTDKELCLIATVIEVVKEKGGIK
jgi:hypothetical protein